MGCMAWKKSGAKKSQVYTMADGTSHYRDMTTQGGGWTMIARVNSDFEWVCPSKKGGNCNKAKEPVTRQTCSTRLTGSVRLRSQASRVRDPVSAPNHRQCASSLAVALLI